MGDLIGLLDKMGKKEVSMSDESPILAWAKKWWGWENFRERLKTKIFLKKINKRNKEFWKTREVVYYTLGDGTPASGIREITDYQFIRGDFDCRI
uniref:Uncharacterized protein n=1 Tax=viral metagenome TaxID=1070528 RepID=A0A6M3MAE8_9ZZZZ